MTTLSIQPPFPILTDADGQPLEDGYIWIGTANLPPIGNPIAVYWDAALTIPAALPIRTRGGYPVNAGTPARLYVNSDYSIRVMNKNGSVVYSAPAATERYGNVINANGVVYDPAGAGAVATTVQEKLRETISSTDRGASPTNTPTQNTQAIQYIIDSFPDGVLIYNPKGCRFNLKDIDGSVNEYNLEYWAEDEADATGEPSVPGTNELVYWASNWKQSGGGTTDVNEWRFQAPYHPGIILNVRENIPHYGSGPNNNGQASIVFKKNNYNQWQINQFYIAETNTFAIGSYEVRLAFPIGSSSFGVAPIANEIIIGDISGARGIVLAVAASTMTVSWLYGTFQAGETVTVAGTKTSTVPLPSAPTFTYFNRPFRFTMPNEKNGVGINTNPSRVTGALFVGGAATLETAQGGGLGTQAPRLALFGDAVTPTTGGSININAGGNLELRDFAENVIGAFDRGTTFTVTVRDGPTGNSVTPAQICFYRESAGIIYFSIRIVNINTAGLTAGNQIHIVGLPIKARNISSLGYFVPVSASDVTSTSGNIMAEIVFNQQYMILWEGTATGRAPLNVSAISSGNGDLFISGCYPS